MHRFSNHHLFLTIKFVCYFISRLVFAVVIPVAVSIEPYLRAVRLPGIPCVTSAVFHTACQPSVSEDAQNIHYATNVLQYMHILNPVVHINILKAINKRSTLCRTTVNYFF